MPDQNRIIPVDVSHAERVVNGLALSFGLSARDTWNPQEVAELATAAEYVCTPGAVAEFVRKGYFGPADPQNLTAVEVYCFLSGLESRRRWRISPSKHDAKKSGARLQIEANIVHGINPPLPDLDDYSIEDLLIQMADAGERNHREVIYEILKLKLEGLEE